MTCIEAWGNDKEERTCTFCGKTFTAYAWEDRERCDVACQLELRAALAPECP